MSYIERAISYYLRKKIFGGFSKLTNKYYLPFAILLFGMVLTVTILEVLYFYGIDVPLNLIYGLMNAQVFLALGFIFIGLVGGRIKKYGIYISFALIISIGMLIAGYVLYGTNVAYEDAIRTIKFVLFLSWVLISSVSLFFIVLYFFTSFWKKVVMMGAPKGHIFFEPLIKFAVIIGIPIYIYMLLTIDSTGISSMVLGIIGLAVSALLLREIAAAKKNRTIPGITNFITAIGWYYLFTIYHAFLSFSKSSGNMTSLVLDIFMLLINLLYIIQRMTYKITEIEDEKKPWEKQYTFHSKINFTVKLKKIFEEKGILMIVFGIVLGYHVVFLESFFNNPLGILGGFITPKLSLNAVYHRLYLLISMIMIVGSIIYFKASDKFKDFMEDKYTIKQVWNYITGYFTAAGEDAITPFEHAVKELGDKIHDGAVKWVDSIKKKFAESMNKRNKPNENDANKNQESVDDRMETG